jgi:hypothetical protein
MVAVKGNVNSLIANTTQLGLSQDAIIVRMTYLHDMIGVDAYGNPNGNPNPPDMQVFGGYAEVQMTLVHYDPIILQECIRLSWGGSPAEGEQARAGTLYGGNVPLYNPGNFYISVGLSSPVGGIPWTFLSCYLADQPFVYPLGTKRSVVDVRWNAIAYSVDPWNGGTGSLGVPVYTHNLLV